MTKQGFSVVIRRMNLLKLEAVLNPSPSSIESINDVDQYTFLGTAHQGFDTFYA
jgi:hypothetical protein